MKIKINIFSVFLLLQLSPLTAFQSKYLETIPLAAENADLKLIAGKNPDALGEEFLKKMHSLFKAKIFVETGTAYGATTIQAASIFEAVHTIELSSYLYNLVTPKFNSHKNIYQYLGDSSNVLPLLLPQLSKKIIFWLDGHYSGGQTAKGNIDCPILQEIEAIKKSKIKNAVIMVDDARIFYPYMASEGYPALDFVAARIHEINDNYKFIVLGDILICIPTEDNITISPVLKACTLSRFFTGANFDIADILDAEKTIGSAEGEELALIQNLIAKFVTNFGQPHIQIFQHYPLWYGLTLLHKKQYSEAWQYFLEAETRGLSHWRIKWYKAQVANHMGLKQECKNLLFQVLQESPNFNEAKELLNNIK